MPNPPQIDNTQNFNALLNVAFIHVALDVCICVGVPHRGKYYSISYHQQVEELVGNVVCCYSSGTARLGYEEVGYTEYHQTAAYLYYKESKSFAYNLLAKALFEES